MTLFPDQSVAESLERSIANAKHLRASHASAIAAARALARKIDAWDVIAQWAVDDAKDSGGRPRVPANDNVSIASYLKYLEALGLLPSVAVTAASPAAAGAAKPKPSTPDEVGAKRRERFVSGG